MPKFYYHTPDRTYECLTIYSVAHSLRQMGKDLRRQADAFGKEYNYVRVCTRDKSKNYNFYGLYYLDGDKMKRRTL